MALAVNAKFNYPQYFVMIPTGPHPHLALTEGFFQIAGQQNPKPETVAILVADAPFSQSPAQGAKDNLARQGMRVVFEGKYPLSTTDFTSYMEDLKRINPEVLFFCSYINDSIGLVKAMNVAGLSPKLVGGAMIGPQNGVAKAELGALLNGLVNYDYWLPVPSLMNPQIQSLIATYQSRAEKTGADPLGYYVAPLAYANIESNNISKFKRPNTQAVVFPPENLTRTPFELAWSPSPASITPAFVSSSLNLPISVSSSSLGITPASEFLLALTITMNVIFAFPYKVNDYIKMMSKSLIDLILTKVLKQSQKLLRVK